LTSLKRSKSVTNRLLSFHVVPSERILESGNVTPCTRFIKLNVKVHDRIHGREGGHEQTHVAFRALPKMVKNAFDRRICGGCEQSPVKFSVTLPECRRGRIIGHCLKTRSVANIIKAHAARVGLEPSQYSAILARARVVKAVRALRVPKHWVSDGERVTKRRLALSMGMEFR
jgi:hypothetical protein